jgi:hypothetical protein
VQHNLWPIAQRSELVYKRARFLYALIQQIPFCLCKHIVLTMLEMRDEQQTSLPFACLVTWICLGVVPDIPAMEPKEKTKDTLVKHTVLKSNAQLCFEDQLEVASPLAQDDPTTTSSSQTTPPPPTTDAMLSRILDTMLSIQREVTTMGICVEQNYINIKRASRNWILRMMMMMMTE